MRARRKFCYAKRIILPSVARETLIRRFVSPLLLLLIGLAFVVTRIPAAQTAQINRDLLWATVKLCVAAKRTVGAALPCETVDLGTAGRPGVALLHVPGQKTHFVLSPVDDIAGLEAPRLLGPDGAVIFRAAWSARQRVVDSSDHPIVLSDVGLAINSAMARSQDHLHVHLDCIGSKIRSALRRTPVEADWTWLPESIGGRRYLARRVRPDGMAALNPFGLLSGYLPDPRLIMQSSLAAVPAEGGGLYLIADVRPNALTERLLDHNCSAHDRIG